MSFVHFDDGEEEEQDRQSFTSFFIVTMLTDQSRSYDRGVGIASANSRMKKVRIFHPVKLLTDSFVPIISVDAASEGEALQM